MLSLTLVPIYFADQPSLGRRLGERLAASLGAEVRFHPPWFDPELSFDPSRGQYSSTVFLDLLREPNGTRPAHLRRPEDRILGVTTVDLFIPILTYVFGEAQLAGPAAVVSTRRLDNEAYGLPADRELLAARLEKEALHELGHTFGLLHCSDLACVMHASTYVEEIDLKSAEFCAACAARGQIRSSRAQR